VGKRAVLSGVLALAALSVGGWMVASAGSSLRASDAAATSSYLHARHTLEHGRGADLSRTRAAVEMFVVAASRECSGAMRRAPHIHAFGALNAEALDGLIVVMQRTNRDVIASFGHSVSNVSWSDSRLTRGVKQLANREAATASLTPPAVCRDITAWARGRYRQVPRTTTRFLHDVSRASTAGATPALPEGLRAGLGNCRRVTPPGHGVICSGGNPGTSATSGREVLRLLARYEISNERRVAHRVQQLERSVEASEQGLFALAAARLSQGLGLDPAVLDVYVRSKLAVGR
jgi:hypothetical protein